MDDPSWWPPPSEDRLTPAGQQVYDAIRTQITVPAGEEREVVFFHTGEDAIYVDGVCVYMPPEGGVPEPRRRVVDWLRERWFYLRNGTPRGLER